MTFDSNAAYIGSMLNLRSATPDDAATMASVHIEAWRAAYRGLVPEPFLAALDRDRRTARFREFLASGAGDTYIIERDSEPVGHLTIGPCRDDDLDERTVGEIWGIYLAPAHWRRGIGARVCRRAERILRARGFGPIVLWVFEGNASARRFYEAMGYAPDAATKTAEVGGPLPAIRYRKDGPTTGALASKAPRRPPDRSR